MPLLTGDLAVTPLVARDGELRVAELEVDEDSLRRHRAPAEVARTWQARLVQTRQRGSGADEVRGG